MSTYTETIGGRSFTFHGLVDVMAKASPQRSGDELAGCAAESETERVAAAAALAGVPLETFLDEDLVPAETDDVTRLILTGHDPLAFEPVRSLTVGELRDWLLAMVVAPTAASGSPRWRAG